MEHPSYAIAWYDGDAPPRYHRRHGLVRWVLKPSDADYYPSAEAAEHVKETIVFADPTYRPELRVIKLAG